MEKIVNRMINDAVEGVDTYKTKDSTWLIFTESKRWVIELTKDGTLWYNYNFFKDLLIYLSMDVVENQHYITKWVEDNVINKVKRTLDLELRNQLNVENTIQNGVKRTRKLQFVFPSHIEGINVGFPLFNLGSFTCLVCTVINPSLEGTAFSCIKFS